MILTGLRKMRLDLEGSQTPAPPHKVLIYLDTFGKKHTPFFLKQSLASSGKHNISAFSTFDVLAHIICK